MYEPWERRNNDELIVPIMNMSQINHSRKKKKIILLDSFTAVYIYWRCFEIGSRGKAA